MMNIIPMLMVGVGSLFIVRASFYVCSLLKKTSFYIPYWKAYLLFLLFFFASYVASIVAAIVNPLFINYFYALVLLLGGIYVWLSCFLSYQTISKIEAAERLHIE